MYDHDEALTQYLEEIGRHKLLTAAEEIELAQRIEKGDLAAKDRMMTANLRLVVSLAKRYQDRGLPLFDLIQEGNVGLLQGVKRFDPHRGVKLSSYAAYWIRAYILKYLIDNIRMVRVGSSRAERKLFFQLSRAKRELEREGLEPEPRLLAEKLGVREPEVVDIQHRLSQGDLSTDAPMRRDEPGGASFGESLPSNDGRVDDAVADQDMRRTLREHVDRFAVGLDARDTKILRERVLAEEPKTLQEIGDELNLTRERVRQLEKKLVDGLRE
ncbi:MAG: sigma-70 family RNA polymerase sigma factor, partial [Myxococcota bacterium]